MGTPEEEDSIHLLLPRPLCNCLSCDSLQSAAIRVDKVPDFWAPGLLGCLREGNLGVHCANTQMNLLKHSPPCLDMN